MVREQLVRHRWSQRELAKVLGISQAAVSYLLGQKRRKSGWVYYEKLARELFGLPLSVVCADLESRVYDYDVHKEVRRASMFDTMAEREEYLRKLGNYLHVLLSHFVALREQTIAELPPPRGSTPSQSGGAAAGETHPNHQRSQQAAGHADVGQDHPAPQSARGARPDRRRRRSREL